MPDPITLPEGYTVKYEHNRLCFKDALLTYMPTHEARRYGYTVSPVGGWTRAAIYDAAGTCVAVGDADCCAHLTVRDGDAYSVQGDQFNRATGRRIALGRALRQLDVKGRRRG